MQASQNVAPTRSSVEAGAVLATLAEWLCCPDDQGGLAVAGDSLLCQICTREFRAVAGAALELLPRAPLNLDLGNDDYAEGYHRAFHNRLVRQEDASAWGAGGQTRSGWLRKRLRHVDYIRALLPAGRRVLCDLSGDAGHYTLAYAPYFNLVLHCDLSVGSLNYVSQRIGALGLTNVVPLRIDYFQPPFRNFPGVMLCFDTLIRGAEHERLLLQAIVGTLGPQGRAVVDFHNWWHNPLRRLGLMKDNFLGNRSYTRRETEELLRRAGIPQSECFPFFQEFPHLRPGALTKILPATRLVYRFPPDA